MHLAMVRSSISMASQAKKTLFKTFLSPRKYRTLSLLRLGKLYLHREDLNQRIGLTVLDGNYVAKEEIFGESGGGVRIVTKEGTEMVASHHDCNTESCGKDDDFALQEISAAFIRPEGAVEWVAVVGLYVSNSPNAKLYRSFIEERRFTDFWKRANLCNRRRPMKAWKYLSLRLLGT